MTRLDLDLIVRRIAWPPWLAALLIASAFGIHEFGGARLAQVTEKRVRAVHALRSAPAEDRDLRESAKPLVQRRYDAFASVLAEKRDVHLLVGRLFEEAEKHSLKLAQAQYTLEFEKAGGFWTYQVSLPVQGRYPDLRRFVNETLRAIPCAALEQVSFRRDGIEAPAAEAKLRFVFYLKDGGT
jgi:hypothetical protein